MQERNTFHPEIKQDGIISGMKGNVWGLSGWEGKGGGRRATYFIRCKVTAAAADKSKPSVSEREREKSRSHLKWWGGGRGKGDSCSIMHGAKSLVSFGSSSLEIRPPDKPSYSTLDGYSIRGYQRLEAMRRHLVEERNLVALVRHKWTAGIEGALGGLCKEVLWLTKRHGGKTSRGEKLGVKEATLTT